MNRDAILATRRRLAEIEAERESLQRELRRLETGKAGPAQATVGKLTAAQKVGLILDLFGARRSVHACFWQNPGTGKQGYAPVRRAGQPVPLDAKAVEAHLRGQQTLGVYAIREDDSCIFLAADFDGSGWRDDVRAYAAAGAAAGVPVAIERSRSGNGAHAWVFLAEPAPSALARRLGTLLLARAGASRPAMGLRTYDRFFPNQDTLPQGGFGNLIALPLAREPRQHGNTVFVDELLNPWPDQWAFLATVPRLSREKLDACMSCAMKSERGLARAGLREWAPWLVGGGPLGLGCEAGGGGLAGSSPPGRLPCRPHGGRQDRQIAGSLGLRVRSEAGSRSCAWSNLEPLKES